MPTKKTKKNEVSTKETLNEKSEKVRTLETELNVDPNGCVEIDMVRRYHITFIEGEFTSDTNLQGNEMYIYTYGKTVNECIFDFWKIVGKQLPELRKHIYRADKWLRDNMITIKPGYRDNLLKEMASDEYGLRHTDPTHVIIERVIPYATIRRLSKADNGDTDMNTTVVNMIIRDENELVTIRQKYLKTIKDAMIKEMENQPMKKMSVMEKNMILKSLDVEAKDRGFGVPKTRQISSMVTICRQLKIHASDSDSFEKCVKTLNKVFTMESIDKTYFMISKKDEIDELVSRVKPVIEEFLIPYFKKYVSEVSMSKRGPLRDLMIHIMGDVAYNNANINTIDITGTYNRIVLDDTTKNDIQQKLRKGDYRSTNEWNAIGRPAEKRRQKKRSIPDETYEKYLDLKDIVKEE